MSRSRTTTKKDGDNHTAGKSSKISFSSEALLQQAIANLLSRMPDNYGVQILQGTQELGKDLVFYKRGGFEEPILHACVVKNSKITGVAEGKGGARTIYIQAEQAFDSVHTDNFGRDVRVERVYVVTPYDLPPETINSIKGKLRDRAGQVVFIDGPRLFDLFKKYWPDYFADEAEILERLLAEVKGVYESESPLQDLATQYNLGDVSQYPRKIYVSQKLFRSIRDYNIGTPLTASLPTLTDVAKDFNKNKIQYIQDKLNYLTRVVAFLYEWGFCNEMQKASTKTSSALVVNALMSAREKYEGKKKSEQEVYNKRQELHSLEKKNVKNKQIVRIEEEIRELSEKVRKLEGEIEAELTSATEAMEVLGRTKKALSSQVQKNLTFLKQTLLSKKLNAFEMLSDPAHLQACIIDDCANAAPEGMFTTKKVGKLSFPRNILEEWGGHLLIVGAPGYGKTSFCRWHALQDAENFSAGKSRIIPLYIPLYRLPHKKPVSFEETFLKNLGKSALFGHIEHSSEVKVRLYLDGLDEIASIERRREVIELAKSGAEGNRKYQIILTSRDYVYARWLDWLPRINIGGFEDNDIKELIDRWLGANSDSNRRFSKQLEDIPALSHLMQTPLLATLIIMVFRQTGKLPENKTKLYENFIGLLSGGWDLAKGVLRKSSYGERVKVQVLSTLASTMQERRLRAFHGEDIRIAAEATLSAEMSKDWELLQEEFIIDGLITKSGNVLQFAHQSFQEFLTAKNFMGSPQPIRANRALGEYLSGNDWWKEVIRFYIGLSTNPREITEWLANRIGDSRSFSYGISQLQIQSLRSAMSEAFPEYSAEALNTITSPS